MRSHTFPRGLRKDRDYLLFEKDHFLFGMGVAMRTLAQSLPPETALDVRATVMEIGAELEAYNITKIISQDFHDAWYSGEYEDILGVAPDEEDSE